MAVAAVVSGLLVGRCGWGGRGWQWGVGGMAGEVVKVGGDGCWG